ncbi:MAG: hypothetical protein JOZ90_06135 [Alphaproteobacteria bacterium]|nr:hypothetical protein [Alphaproteobacteria bacterium]MBV9372717.1 hypothetical protein [Alphaproteobacteria bacterium]MBV9900658.1 hypothetical protein [Alphaproteobacteria bacterium]
MKSLAQAAALALLAADPAAAVNCALKPGVTAEQAAAGLCGYDEAARRFAGTAAEQAACLTREVRMRGTIGAPTLTGFLRRRAGQAVGVPGDRLAAYLASLGIDAARELGGDPAVAVTADYFIIHDTSTPNCSESGWSATLCPEPGKLPAGRDTAAWAAELGYLGHPKPAPDRLAHAWTNRVGGSITEVTFDLPLRSTKFESCLGTAAKAGLFLAVENTQPRAAEPGGPLSDGRMNDRIAPRPGFTAAQYDRLALLYVAASVRRGRWLIPAFHAVLDARFAEGHDDPQNFDMPAWSAAVRRHARALARQAR